MSPTSNPSRPLTLTKHSVCALLIVNGRIALLNGPTPPTTLWVAGSAIGQDRRVQAGQVDTRAVGAVDGVVRARTGHDLGEHVAGRRVDGVPVRPLERGHVEDLAVRRERDAVGAPS